ncbi:MAG: coproporphyrinogen dehydrogenase HemZ [Eubacteriales bacterium]|nr:coproporphyrinogen dehydrogenase HemZ [Eubacteriales bacterium]
MIVIETKDESYLYNIYHLVKAFYPSGKVEQRVCVDRKKELCIRIGDTVKKEFQIPGTEDRRMRKYLLDRQVYEFLAGITGRRLAWGILTGVRPTKIAMQKVEEGMGREEFLRWFQEDSLVSEEKAELAYDIAAREKEILSRLDYRDGYSLYVGIPFCPTVCSYCSFSSGPIALWKDSVDAYLDALCREISYIGTVSKEKKLNTIYIGGGTPTTLEAGQLERLLACIDASFSREHLLEYTVEAGRPDSITEEKLAVIQRYGITRISINPQTMQQKTLDLIGRRHRVEDITEVYRMARALGFDNINMDLIAGLPGETAADMEDTLKQIKALGPDSLTVHALAIKRAAQMGQEKSTLGYVKDLEKQTKEPERMAGELSRMIDGAGRAAGEMGLVPYYLYRQKNIAGNFENVGYAKVDKAGIYNILIMEEKQSIVAAGAGASTKIVLPEPAAVPGNRNGKMTTLMRVENVKNIREYISRIDEMIERKGEWLWR